MPRASRSCVRIGAHLGRVVEQAGDLFGDTVNVAARMAAIAIAGQIILTRTLAEHLGDPMAGNLRPLGDVAVTGHNDAVTILEYLWRQGEMTSVRVAARPARDRRLKLSVDGRETWLDRERRAARIGRAVDTEVLVNAKEASRQHATIAIPGDRFVLIDHSSNGTYVAAAAMAEICLRREELILPAKGVFALGLSTTALGAALVTFERE